MGRNKFFGVVNIVAHPHPTGTYRKIFELASLIVEGVNFHGDLYARLSAPSPSEQGVFRGKIAVWTEIDQGEPLIFKESLEQAMIAETDINLPSSVGFNSKIFYYAFREVDHTLFVELENDQGGSISVNRVVLALQSIFDRIEVEVVCDISVYVKSKREAVPEVLDIFTIRKIRIVVNIPNPDDVDDPVQRVYRKLREMNVKQVDTVFTKLPGDEGVKLSPENMILAEAAKDNGYVDASGLDERGAKVEKSTREHPDTVALGLEHDVLSYSAVLLAATNVAAE